MGLTIYTLYICLLLSITGSGLALRGPEGSVHRAVLTLARGCRRVIQAYALALYLFMLSIFTKVRQQGRAGEERGQGHLFMLSIFTRGAPSSGQEEAAAARGARGARCTAPAAHARLLPPALCPPRPF